jgi:hypothetical protein
VTRAREIVAGRKAKRAFVRIAPTSKYDDTKRTFFKLGNQWRKRVTPSGRVVWEPVE